MDSGVLPRTEVAKMFDSWNIFKPNSTNMLINLLFLQHENHVGNMVFYESFLNSKLFEISKRKLKVKKKKPIK